jgi:uncharacterized membrane protein
LGFACSNDYFYGTIFLVPGLFTTKPGNLQHEILKKKNMLIVAIVNVNFQA